MRETRDGGIGNVLSAALDRRDVGLLCAHAFREFLLRKPCLLACLVKFHDELHVRKLFVHFVLVGRVGEPRPSLLAVLQVFVRMGLQVVEECFELFVRHFFCAFFHDTSPFWISHFNAFRAMAISRWGISWVFLTYP